MARTRLVVERLSGVLPVMLSPIEFPSALQLTLPPSFQLWIVAWLEIAANARQNSTEARSNRRQVLPAAWRSGDITRSVQPFAYQNACSRILSAKFATALRLRTAASTGNVTLHAARATLSFFISVFRLLLSSFEFLLRVCRVCLTKMSLRRMAKKLPGPTG